MKIKILLLISLVLNAGLLFYILKYQFMPKAPYPYGSFYIGTDFSDNWNDGEKLKDFLLPKLGQIVALNFWMDTGVVHVETDANGFGFSTSMSITDPNDYSESAGIDVRITKLPQRQRLVNIYRDGNNLSITGIFLVSEILHGRQGISHIVLLSPED